MKKLVKAGTAIVLVALVLLLLLYGGVLQFNNPSVEQFPVRGVDVSSYQGDIDWEILAGQGIHFAYIKATEGSTHVDSHFGVNWENAQKTDLRIGAYHFFSFESSGATQAENFMAAVTPVQGMLPPVIDVEFYQDFEKNPPEKAAVAQELQTMADALEAYYGMRPVLYATIESYRAYLQEGFAAYGLWIRSVFRAPELPENVEWIFWQYTNRKRLDGYRGKEAFIDVNVFSGSEQDFAAYGSEQSKNGK